MADVTLSEDVRMLLLEAVWELDKLGRILPGLVPLDEDQTHFAVKGIGGRMTQLTSALMEGLDGTASEEHLKGIINFA
jgi:hypothetical protein